MLGNRHLNTGCKTLEEEPKASVCPFRRHKHCSRDGRRESFHGPFVDLAAAAVGGRFARDGCTGVIGVYTVVVHPTLSQPLHHRQAVESARPTRLILTLNGRHHNAAPLCVACSFLSRALLLPSSVSSLLSFVGRDVLSERLPLVYTLPNFLTGECCRCWRCCCCREVTRKRMERGLHCIATSSMCDDFQTDWNPSVTVRTVGESREAVQAVVCRGRVSTSILSKRVKKTPVQCRDSHKQSKQYQRADGRGAWREEQRGERRFVFQCSHTSICAQRRLRNGRSPLHISPGKLHLLILVSGAYA